MGFQYNDTNKEGISLYEFLEYVLWELRNSIGLAFLAALGATLVLLAALLLHRRKYGREKRFPWGKAMLWIVFAGYLAVVLYATVLRGAGFFRREWNLHLFRAWREAWNNFSAKNWANVLLNVAMFVPLGFLLPLLRKQFRKWYLTVPAGFVVSLGIELFQLAVGRGICDVDDLFANTLGAAIGFFAVMLVLALAEGKKHGWGNILVYGSLLTTTIMAICSIFAVYAWQEYGNLPGAAAYSADLSGLEWHLACELPADVPKTSIYRNQTRKLEDCDAFAADFSETVGTVFDDISYYQEAAYYMNHGSENGYHFLYVHYLDEGYEYSCGYFDEPVWVETERNTLEAALEKFPLQIPENAEFVSDGDGWHSFIVERYMDGGVMIDGMLRCRYAEDGTVRNIENDLLRYTYYGEVEILSPEQAYAQVRKGKFAGADVLKKAASDDISVISCTLEYEIDTKGFYQPVYWFTAVISENEHPYRIMIPAMK